MFVFLNVSIFVCFFWRLFKDMEKKYKVAQGNVKL